MALLLVLATSGTGWAAQEKMVGILLSQEIAPYVSMVEGLEARLHAATQRFFLDAEGKPYSLGGARAALDPQAYDVLVAVGPEALKHLQSVAGDRPLVFGMVLNPEKLLSRGKEPLCGVSLNLAADGQFAAILRHLPNLKRLGVLFDPDNNQTWFDAAAPIAVAKGFELVPLQARRQEGKLDVGGDFAGLDAILFIPDKSIISKAAIQYVIKQGVLHNTPVIGYNQFFHDSGAALNFMIDYEKAGRQVAGLAERLLTGEKCMEIVSPDFGVVVNDPVWQALKKAGKGRE